MIAEVTELGRQFGFGGPADQFLTDSSMGDQLFDADDLQIPLFGDRSEPVTSCPFARIVQDFAQRGGGVKPSHACQIDRRFGVAGATQHASLFGQQRKDVSRPNKIFDHTIWISQTSNRFTSFGRRDPRLGGAHIDGCQKRGLQRGVVLGRHRAKFKPSRDLRQNRNTKLPSAREHEIDRLGCRFLRRADVIPLVLAIFRVHDDDNLATPNGVNRFRDRIEFNRHADFRKSEVRRVSTHAYYTGRRDSSHRPLSGQFTGNPLRRFEC